MSGPGVFGGLPHLSEDAVAASADGVLSPSAAIRAERHCAECVECAAAVRGQREAAMMLRSASAPRMPSGLLDRLSGVPMSTQLPPPMSGLPTVMSSDGTPMFVARKLVDRSDDGPAGGGQHSFGSMRRSVVPLGLLASAAAVVAAGTFGAHVLARPGHSFDQHAPASIQQISVVRPPVQSSSNGPTTPTPLPSSSVSPTPLASSSGG